MPTGSQRQRRSHAPSRRPAAKANPVGAKSQKLVRVFYDGGKWGVD